MSAIKWPWAKAKPAEQVQEKPARLRNYITVKSDETGVKLTIHLHREGLDGRYIYFENATDAFRALDAFELAVFQRYGGRKR